jgi:hypothetical protein
MLEERWWLQSMSAVLVHLKNTNKKTNKHLNTNICTCIVKNKRTPLFKEKLKELQKPKEQSLLKNVLYKTKVCLRGVTQYDDLALMHHTV